MNSFSHLFFFKLSLSLLFFLTIGLSTSDAQTKLKLQWIPDLHEWAVFAKSYDSLNSPITLYNFQVSIAASLDFELGEIDGGEKLVQLASESKSPQEQPTKSYYDFFNAYPTPIELKYNEAYFLFSFGSKSGNCPDTLYLVQNDDPFIAPNSKSLNTGNSIEIYEYYPEDGYRGIYKEEAAKCDDSANISRISGSVFLDLNLNGTFDEEERLLHNQALTLLPNNKTVFSSRINGFNFFVERGEYQLRPKVQELWELTNQDTVVDVSTLDSSVVVNFGLFPLNGLDKYRIVSPVNLLRCNTNTLLNFSIHNESGTNGNGLVKITLNSEIEPLDFFPEPDFISDNTYFWYFNDLFITYDFPIKIAVNTPDETLTGNELASTVELYLIQEDESLLLFDTTQWKTNIRCSYDPNDKLVKPQNEESENWLLPNQPLEYTVRFQNTGNDTAYHITIRDQLDEHLDWTTFKPLSASHDYIATMNENGMCEFLFENIYLVDSLTNPISSQGFLTYEIYPKLNLLEGQELMNTAEIYFDENEPIITNTTKNTFTYNLSTSTNSVEKSMVSVSVYPNPFKEGVFFNIKENLGNQKLRVRLFNIEGKQLLERKIDKQNLFISIGNEAVILYEIFDVLTQNIIQSDKLVQFKY